MRSSAAKSVAPKTASVATSAVAPTDEDVREIAEHAQASTHSVWKRLAGAEVKGRVSKRIDEAIARWRGRGRP